MKTTIAAIFVIALIFTFSCSSGDDNGSGGNNNGGYEEPNSNNNGNNNNGGQGRNCVDMYNGLKILDIDKNLLEVTKAIDCNNNMGLGVPLANKDTLWGLPYEKGKTTDRYPFSNVGGYDYLSVDFTSVR
ncbi:MAG: hypothetical protein LBH25_12205 [Fibromonadaceae bacterium]|jgi:hypothetical protein|nr:hypothetical protein [Fibromonadaceae bacterium]